MLSSWASVQALLQLPYIWENNTAIVVSTISGNVESYEQGFLTGWVYDRNLGSSGVAYSVFSQNVKVGSGVAKQFRQDLLDNGIGDGHHGFCAELSEHVMDGKSHELHVVVDDTGELIGKLTVASEAFAESDITEIVAGNINGTFELKNAHEATGFDIEILVDGKVQAVGVCSLNSENAKYEFSVKLPDRLFDDHYHFYGARLKWLSTKINLFQEKIPSIVTPWEHLNDDISVGNISSIPKIAGYRYKALQSQLRNINSTGSDSHDLEAVITAHDVLVEGFDNRRVFPLLKLPKHDSPAVSVIIPVHNKFSLTYNCIASLILASNKASFEVIVVDDLSTDETVDIEDFVENVNVVKNTVNKGFLRSCTAGVEQAKGDYYLFLNNDTEVTDEWIDELLAVFEKFDGVGIAGSKLIYPNGDLQEAGGIVWNSGKPWNYGNGDNAEHPRFNYVRQADYLSGASLMINKSAWEQVDGFSDSYAPAYYEDVDLAFKVREIGLKTYYCPASVVVHFEGMSNGRSVDSGVKQFQSINGPRFRKQWRHSYRNNGQEGQLVDLEKDRNFDFRVLFVDYSTPRPDQDAGGYAASQEIKILQELGCKVTFVPNNMAHLGTHTRTLQNDGVECLYAPFYSNVGEVLASRGREFDLIYIIRYDIAEEIIPYVKQYTNAKVVLNNCDLHFLREIRSALESGGENMEGPLNTRERELNVIKQVDALLSYNEVEHSIVASHNLTEKNIFKCPWILTPKESNIAFDERKDIAFLGSFNHAPNGEAVHYFVKNVMPGLREALPDVRLKVYGSRMSEDIEDLASDDVLIMGYADCLSSVYDSCRVFVAPLLSGAGIKGKVLESMAFGCPSVLSPVAAEATGLHHGTSTLIANSDSEWVECLKELYTDQKLWEKIAHACQEPVRTRYSFSNGLREMSVLMEYLELDPALNRPTYYKLNSL